MELIIYQSFCVLVVIGWALKNNREGGHNYNPMTLFIMCCISAIIVPIAIGEYFYDFDKDK